MFEVKYDDDFTFNSLLRDSGLGVGAPRVGYGFDQAFNSLLRDSCAKRHNLRTAYKGASFNSLLRDSARYSFGLRLYTTSLSILS